MTNTQFDKGISSTQTQRNRDIKCFKYLASGHIASEDENDSNSNGTTLDASDTEHAIVGQTIVIL